LGDITRLTGSDVRGGSGAQAPKKQAAVKATNACRCFWVSLMRNFVLERCMNINVTAENSQILQHRWNQMHIHPREQLE
jgi:hypothetical protein